MDDQQQQTDPAPMPDTPASGPGVNNFVPPIKPKHIFKALLKFVLILILIAAVAGGVYWFITNRTNKPAKPVTTSQPSTTQNTSVTNIDKTTKHYASSNYNLGFDYPVDWIVADTAGTNLTVTSPEVQLKDTADQTIPGKIVMTIENQQATLPSFATDSAIAALESQKISYKSPTPNQRAQTYVTFVNYAGTGASINALYITGDNGYQGQQAIPQSDIIQDNPLISISFVKCSDAACKANPTATAIASNSWSDTSLSKPLITMLESLVIE